MNNYLSHPTWVRGLKSEDWKTLALTDMSHPTWVRGLKCEIITCPVTLTGRTPRGCVD